MTLSEYEQYSKEHSIIPVSRELCDEMINNTMLLAKYKGVLQEIRLEIDEMYLTAQIPNDENYDVESVLIKVLAIIDKHIAEVEEHGDNNKIDQ